MEYKAIRVESYLAHHGIPGQKHGVRNGPPYPLGSNQKSAAEKKAEGKRTSWDEKSKIATINTGGKKNEKSRYKKIKSIEKSKDRNIPSREKKIAGIVDQEIIDHLRQTGQKISRAREKFDNAYEDELDKVYQSPKLLRKYFESIGDDTNANDLPKYQRSILMNDYLEGIDVLAEMGITNSRIENARRELQDARQEHMDLARTYANEWLGEYADKPVTSTINAGGTTLPASRWVTAAIANYTERYAWK